MTDGLKVKPMKANRLKAKRINVNLLKIKLMTADIFIPFEVIDR